MKTTSQPRFRLSTSTSAVLSCSFGPEQCVQAYLAAPRYPEFRVSPQKGPAFRLGTESVRGSPFLVAMLIGFVFFASIARTQAGNYFISASGPLGDGSGSSAA